MNGVPGTAFHSNQSALIELMLDRLLGSGETGRVPVVVFLGDSAARLATAAAADYERTFGTGASVGTGTDAWRTIDSPLTRAAFLAIDEESVIREGLPVCAADAIVVSSAADERLIGLAAETLPERGVLCVHKNVVLSKRLEAIAKRKRIRVLLARTRTQRGIGR